MGLVIDLRKNEISRKNLVTKLSPYKPDKTLSVSIAYY